MGNVVSSVLAPLTQPVTWRHHPWILAEIRDCLAGSEATIASWMLPIFQGAQDLRVISRNCSISYSSLTRDFSADASPTKLNWRLLRWRVRNASKNFEIPICLPLIPLISEPSKSNRNFAPYENRKTQSEISPMRAKAPAEDGAVNRGPTSLSTTCTAINAGSFLR